MRILCLVHLLFARKTGQLHGHRARGSELTNAPTGCPAEGSRTTADRISARAHSASCTHLMARPFPDTARTILQAVISAVLAKKPRVTRGRNLFTRRRGQPHIRRNLCLTPLLAAGLLAAPAVLERHMLADGDVAGPDARPPVSSSGLTTRGRVARHSLAGNDGQAGGATISRAYFEHDNWCSRCT